MPETLRPWKLPAGKNPLPTGSPAAEAQEAAPADIAALRRMRQLAGEIQEALRRGDMDVVNRAADLLAPALSQLQQSRADLTRGEAAEIARQTCALLAACEQAMATEMTALSQEMLRLRHGKQALARLRRRRNSSTGSKLDTLR